jgi:hypothetical protein
MSLIDPQAGVARAPEQLGSAVRGLLARWVIVLALTLAALTVSVVSAAGIARAEECPNAAYRTGSSAHLPDCRAYELMSPPFKNSGQPLWQAYSPNGESGLMDIGGGVGELGAFPEISIYGAIAQYSTQRTASGWTALPDSPPASEYLPGGIGLVRSVAPFAGMSLDGLTTVWIERRAGQPGNSLGLFERLPDRSIVEIGSALSPTAPLGTPTELEEATKFKVVGVSSDASRLVYTLRADYWPFDGTEGTAESLYEFAGTDNAKPMLVGVNQSGALISKCGTVLGGPASEFGTFAKFPENFHNAMSTSGQAIFFTAMCGERTNDELYARIDNGEPDARTVDISEPSRADCSVCDTEAGVLAGAHFLGGRLEGVLLDQAAAVARRHGHEHLRVRLRCATGRKDRACLQRCARTRNPRGAPLYGHQSRGLRGRVACLLPRKGCLD